MPQTLGDKIAPLLGANPGEVIVVDSTSVNLFKVLSSALILNKSRKVIVSEASNFPSDLYILEGVNEMFGNNFESCLIEEGETDIEKYIDSSTAVVMLSHINYKTGRISVMMNGFGKCIPCPPYHPAFNLRRRRFFIKDFTC